MHLKSLVTALFVTYATPSLGQMVYEHTETKETKGPLSSIMVESPAKGLDYRVSPFIEKLRSLEAEFPIKEETSMQQHFPLIFPDNSIQIKIPKKKKRVYWYSKYESWWNELRETMVYDKDRIRLEFDGERVILSYRLGKNYSPKQKRYEESEQLYKQNGEEQLLLQKNYK